MSDKFETNALRQQINSGNYELLDASSADAIATYQKCKAITCDEGGKVKIDYKNEFGETKTETLSLVAGIDKPLVNVTKLYRYTSGTTAGTAKSYSKSDSTITNAVKIRW